MKNSIPCITDSEEWRYMDEEIEEESQLTTVEQHISWIFDDWQSAIADDTYESWGDVRMVVYGALQAYNQTSGFYAELEALRFLRDVAFELCFEALRRNLESWK